MSESKKILIVEDEQELAQALAGTVACAGFVVESAFNGDEALEKLAAKQYDAILLDIILPKSDGLFVLEQLRSTLKLSTPVIVLTNLGQDEDRERAKELGAESYFIKADTPLKKIAVEINRLIAR